MTDNIPTQNCMICGEALFYDPSLSPTITKLLRFHDNLKRLEDTGYAITIHGDPPEIHGEDTVLYCVTLMNDMHSEKYFHGDSIFEAIEEAVKEVG